MIPLLLCLAAAPIEPAALAGIDAAVNDALAAKAAPGAVVLVSRHGTIVYRKAFGSRAVAPAKEAMTADTVFDLASLTKPVATATAVHLLAERGKLSLDDLVSKHLPAFKGRDGLTLRHLLTHTSGLPAGNAVGAYADGREKAVERIAALKANPPGERFVYSDLGYILLGEIVAKASGKSLADFCRDEVFLPTGLKDTGFVVDKSALPRVAPTEKVGDAWLRGTVHDPRARALGGVAGHAGLFGTADDLAAFAHMLLAKGVLGGRRVLAETTVAALTTPVRVPGGYRTLGYDADTAYSSNRGDLLGGFGHTGFTGTSLWVDPACGLVVVVLTNRVHPDGKGNVLRLRSRIATIAAKAVTSPPFPAARPGMTLAGIDVLKRENFARLKGKRVGLVTNHTGRDRDGNATIDLIHKAPGVTLVALFGPEHGIRGALDEVVPDGKDAATGLPVYSLYGKNRKPTAEQLKGVDVLVYDIADVGCRFYTYSTTLGLLLESGAANKVPVMVLDRPNPVGGVLVEGGVIAGAKESFVAYHSVPVRHGMTLGELATLFNAERKIGCALDVVKCDGWKRGDLFDATGLEWVNPSPNLRSLYAALLYPGVGLLETTNLSVGRGTDRPFEQVGAPWMDGVSLARALNAAGLAGVRFIPVRFTPTSSVHAKKECRGVQIVVTDREALRSVATGFAIAAALRKQHPEEWQVTRYNTLLANTPVFEALKKGESAAALLKTAEAGRAGFLAVRRKYLLYAE